MHLLFSRVVVTNAFDPFRLFVRSLFKNVQTWYLQVVYYDFGVET